VASDELNVIKGSDVGPYGAAGHGPGGHQRTAPAANPTHHGSRILVAQALTAFGMRRSMSDASPSRFRRRNFLWPTIWQRG
jgi:hypothetical protein